MIPCRYQTTARPLTLWLAADATLFQGLAPANPSVRDLSYLMLRNQQPAAQVTCVFDLNDSNPLLHVEVETNGEILSIELIRQQQTMRINIPLTSNQLPQFSQAYPS